MELNYKQLGRGQSMIILHGLLGMLDNWMTPAKKFAEQFEVFLIDQRNHGHSPHSDEFNYQAMADDIFGFTRDHGLTDIIVLGHSMGGKTAMKFALEHGDLVDKLIIVDIAPKKYQGGHDRILEGLSAVDFNQVSSRSEVDEILKSYVPETGIRQFLLKSLYWKEKNHLDWRFNLESIKKNYQTIIGDIDHGIFEKPTLFIRGEQSGYVKDEDFRLIKKNFPNAELSTIPGAGHWVHAEQPEKFLDGVVDFLRKH